MRRSGEEGMAGIEDGGGEFENVIEDGAERDREREVDVECKDEGSGDEEDDRGGVAAVMPGDEEEDGQEEEKRADKAMEGTAELEDIS